MQERYNTMGGKHVWVRHQAGWSVGTFTIMSRLLVQTAHCILQSLTWFQYRNSRVWCKFWWCITKLALLIATHNLAFTAVNSPNALKDSMHAIMESYEVTPHIYQHCTNTINVINFVILLPRWALLMLCLSESINRHSSNSFSSNVIVIDQEPLPLPPSPSPPTSHKNSVDVSSTSGAHSGSPPASIQHSEVLHTYVHGHADMY